MMKATNLGSDFDDFLEEEDLLEEVTAIAVKRVIAFQLQQKMSELCLSKTEMAKRMRTSRSSLDRLLDPSNASVSLQTLHVAAGALGGRLKVELAFHSDVA
jgi:antitoxin HicB